MNLFGGGAAPAKVEAPPSIDEAQQRAQEQRRGRQLRGRAATMLTTGRGQTPTGQATVTGS